MGQSPSSSHCETKQTWFLHLATAVAAVLVAAAGTWAWRAGRGPIDTADAATAPLSAATGEARTRWMAWFAVGSSIWFVVVILAMSVPVVVPTAKSPPTANRQGWESGLVGTWELGVGWDLVLGIWSL